MSSSHHETNFLIFGVGLVAAAIGCLFLGTVGFMDVLAALFAAYVVLRLVNAMSRAEKQNDKR